MVEEFLAGHAFVTNGPLLRTSVAGQPPGDVIHAAAGEELELEIGMTLSTADPVSYLDIVQNGEATQSIRLGDFTRLGGCPSCTSRRAAGSSFAP